MTPDPTKQLFRLTEDYLNCNLNRFLCDDSAPSSRSRLLSVKHFAPESFTVSDRINAMPFLTEMQRGFDDWCRELILDQLSRAGLISTDQPSSFGNQLQLVRRNLDLLLEFEVEGKKLGEAIWNQEFIDVLRRIITYTVCGDPTAPFDTHVAFNQFSRNLMPPVIDLLRQHRYTPQEILTLSIYSGLSGLDMKGSGAAASTFAHAGIPMEPLMSVSPSDAALLYWNQLRTGIDASRPIFEWRQFEEESTANGPSHIAWFTDDLIETYLDLAFLESFLMQCDLLHVTLISRSGIFGNDASYEDILSILASDLFPTLSTLLKCNRLQVCSKGPSMGALNLKKLSPEAVRIVAASDIVVVKGCRAHEMVQGGLNKPSYTGYVVSREYSESVSGLDARKSPILFFKLDQGEYAFYGFRERHLRLAKFPDRAPIMLCTSTLMDHSRRKHLTDPKLLVVELQSLFSKSLADPKTAALKEANMIAEKLIVHTVQSYDKTAPKYQEVRGCKPHEPDMASWQAFLETIRGRMCYPADSATAIRILDIGTGPGRDIAYASRLAGVEIVGVDNSPGMIRILEQLCRDGEIPPGSFRFADMRDLTCFADATFDGVRHNATLVHMPVLGPGYGADLALAECHRVLKNTGVLIISVKEGQGMQMVDTEEGLGARFYQFYTEPLLDDLLRRNRFEILRLQKRPSSRDPNVLWIQVLAIKKSASA